MGLFGSSSSEEGESKRMPVGEEIDWEQLISSSESVLFSCTNDGPGEERELFVTPTRIVVRVGTDGGSFPIESSSIMFGERNGLFRVTVSNGDFGYGIRIEKKKFERFWDIVTEQRSE